MNRLIRCSEALRNSSMIVIRQPGLLESAVGWLLQCIHLVSEMIHHFRGRGLVDGSSELLLLRRQMILRQEVVKILVTLLQICGHKDSFRMMILLFFGMIGHY